ncbi:hypothetical protein [Nitrosomonas sp.]|uniref:hypothetical protein n=1 Tax=Nitrosomonas sp. TaxID=42353 RepID=UPI0025DE6631|nr:hypothetical protein [Nitrosomonas sp.]
MKKLSIILLLASLLSGCSSLLSQKTAELAPSRETQGKGETLTIPAQLRTITNKNNIGSFVSCAEPGPDVAMSDTFKLITGITSDTSSSVNSGTGSTASAGNKASLNNDLQTSTTALELAGRTQIVLLAREFLYRTCEAASNGWIDGTKVGVAHTEIIKQITGLIETDKKKAETSAAIAVAIATGKLDTKIMGNTSTAFGEAIRNACVKTFEDCIAKPGIDEKNRTACRSTFNDCLK